MVVLASGVFVAALSSEAKEAELSGPGLGAGLGNPGRNVCSRSVGAEEGEWDSLRGKGMGVSASSEGEDGKYSLAGRSSCGVDGAEGDAARVTRSSVGSRKRVSISAMGLVAAK